jgi:hypothetical protein
MAEDDPIGHVLGTPNLTVENIKQITGGNAARLLGIDI